MKYTLKEAIETLFSDGRACAYTSFIYFLNGAGGSSIYETPTAQKARDLFSSYSSSEIRGVIRLILYYLNNENQTEFYNKYRRGRSEGRFMDYGVILADSLASRLPA
ncbi:MAG: hypothetical protein ABIM88_07345, partial [candidate division WOR-3 bacterium]